MMAAARRGLYGSAGVGGVDSTRLGRKKGGRNREVGLVPVSVRRRGTPSQWRLLRRLRRCGTAEGGRKDRVEIVAS